MRHQQYNPTYQFIKEPMEFDKYTPREQLRYCVGAALYMPATKNFAKSILNNSLPGLTSMVMCFEDAIAEDDVPQAEDNALQLLDTLVSALKNGSLKKEQLPLLFFRVRNLEQFLHFSAKLKPEWTPLITGFVFPKFNAAEGSRFFDHLLALNNKFQDILYGMPILEGKEIAYKETRTQELVAVKEILEKYKDYVLNVRVGATDFSSCFGVRRGIDYTIYDILTVRDCLLDILNTFSRNNDFVLSGPVWEYFAANKSLKFEDISGKTNERSLLTRTPIIDDAIDGLLREVVLDKANGFIGKTIVHPTHLKYVNAMLAVTEEEYNDALQIINAHGGVIKGVGAKANKMNEIKPHTSWALKISSRANVYGVIKDESEYFKLFL